MELLRESNLLDLYGQLVSPNALVASLPRLDWDVAGTAQERKKLQLEALALAYELYLAIKSTPTPKAYFSALRKHSGLVRDDGREVSWVLRALFPKEKRATQGRDQSATLYAQLATAVEHLQRLNVSPETTVTFGLRTDQSVSGWIKAEKDLRSGVRPKPKSVNLRPLMGDLFKKPGDRALVAVQLTDTEKPKLRVVNACELSKPKLVKDEVQWDRIRKAASTSSLRKDGK